MLQHIPILAAGQHAGQALGGLPGGAGSLYIHTPFCTHKCHYCDFYSLADPRDRQGPFVERLSRELAALSAWAGPLRTIFVGGGTPSLLRTDLWGRILGVLHSRFDLSAILGGEGEFTVECNPESVTPELLGVLRAGGVNRLSMGAQSFHLAHLRTLERRHDPESVPRAIGLARAAGFERLSLDLIFAIPGQTLGDWLEDLDTALALGTTHLSCYALTYEPGTAMTARLRRGEFAPVEEDLDAEMYEAAVGRLRAGGLERYEVSNFARPGEACRHNLAYWRQEDWLAAGPSASAHVAGWRWKNVPRLDDYLAGDVSGFSPITDLEGADERRALRERLMTGIRLREGVPIERTLERAGGIDAALPGRLRSVVDRQAEWGAIETTGSAWRLTDRGFLVADAVARDFMLCVEVGAVEAGPGQE